MGPKQKSERSYRSPSSRLSSSPATRKLGQTKKSKFSDEGIGSSLPDLDFTSSSKSSSVREAPGSSQLMKSNITDLDESALLGTALHSSSTPLSSGTEARLLETLDTTQDAYFHLPLAKFSRSGEKSSNALSLDASELYTSSREKALEPAEKDASEAADSEAEDRMDETVSVEEAPIRVAPAYVKPFTRSRGPIQDDPDYEATLAAGSSNSRVRAGRVERPILKCGICGMTSRQRAQLRIHMKSHVAQVCEKVEHRNGPSTYRCAMCQKICKNKAGLMSHLQVHIRPSTPISI